LTIFLITPVREAEIITSSQSQSNLILTSSTSLFIVSE
jgi:hypothetical protein